MKLYTGAERKRACLNQEPRTVHMGGRAHPITSDAGFSRRYNMCRLEGAAWDMTQVVEPQQDTSACVDDSVPVDYLLGKQNSGYYQPLNSMGKLVAVHWGFPEMFWGLSKVRRRMLATRMLEAGLSGPALEQAIRSAIDRREPLEQEGYNDEAHQTYPTKRCTRQQVRAPRGTQPVDHNENIEGGLDGIGPDGRPVDHERYRPRAPFLVIESGEPYRYGRNTRADKFRARDDCDAARRRRAIQENMRVRVQAQEQYLAGLEQSKRDWRRYEGKLMKSSLLAAAQRKLRVRLNYGNGQRKGTRNEETTPLESEFNDTRREKQEFVRALKDAREEQWKRNIECVKARRREKEIMKAIRAEKDGGMPSCSAARGSNTFIQSKESPSLREPLSRAKSVHGGEHPSTLEEEKAGTERVVPEGREYDFWKIREDQEDDKWRVNLDCHKRETRVSSHAHLASDSGRDRVRSARTGGIDPETGDKVLGKILERLIRASSTQELTMKPPPVLEVQDASHRLAGRNRSRSWRFRHPLPTRCQSERTFKGGGWRVNSSPSLLLTDAGTVRGKVPLFPGRYFGIEALDPEAISNAGGTHKSQKWKQHSCSRNRFVPMADDEAK